MPGPIGQYDQKFNLFELKDEMFKNERLARVETRTIVTPTLWTEPGKSLCNDSNSTTPTLRSAD